MSLLYLLVNEDETAIKIGVSHSPHNRAAQLPVTINLSRSLQIEFCEGSANAVEKMLHYWFREHRQEMPPGDGCTEWFRIEALPEVIQFLQKEGRRLGVSGMHPLRQRLPPKEDSAKAAKLQAKTLKLEATRIREEGRAERYAEALAKAATHNAKVFDCVQNSFRDLYAANVIADILPPNAGDPYADGHLYLQGVSRNSALNHLSEPRFFDVVGPGRLSRLFPGSFYSSTYQFAVVSILRHFISGTCFGNDEQNLPGADKIRAYLRSLICDEKTPEHKTLFRIQRKLIHERARFSEQWQRGWFNLGTAES